MLPVPGKTMPTVTVVERDYPHVYERFTALGPLMDSIGNGIKELWTADRDFTWFPELHTHNQLTLNPLTKRENR